MEGGGSSMQVDISLVLAGLSAVFSGGLAVVVTLARITIQNRETEIDRRIGEIRTKSDDINARLHTEEKATIRQDGDLRLVQTTHTNLTNDVQEIKQTMATKEEVRHIGRTMDKVLERLDDRRDGPQRRYTPGAGTYSGATDPPKTQGR